MEVRSAFQNLLDSLRHELDGTKAAGSHAFELGEFENAQKAASQGKTIGEMLSAVQAIADQWDAVQFADAAKPEPKSKSTPKATPEPEPEPKAEPHMWNPIPENGDFIVPILQALEDSGGRSKTDALDIDGGSKRWKKAMPSVRKEMTKKGYIYANTPVDEWQITPQGRLYLFEQIDPTQNA